MDIIEIRISFDGMEFDTYTINAKGMKDKEFVRHIDTIVSENYVINIFDFRDIEDILADIFERLSVFPDEEATLGLDVLDFEFEVLTEGEDYS